MFPVGEEQVLNGYQMGAMRIVIAGFAMLPFAIRNFRYLTKKDLLPILIVGVCGNLLPATLFSLAETGIDSSLAGMLNMGTSFFVVIIGMIFFKVSPSRVQFAGLILGATGLFLILRSQLVFEVGQTGYAILILLATLFYATSLTTIKYKLQHLPAMAITSLAFFLIFWPALITAVFVGSFTQVFGHPDGFKSLGFLSVLAIVGTAIAVFLFNKLVAISNPIFASGVTYLMPVVAIFLGIILDHDQFQWVSFAWISLIITGVWLLSRKPKNLTK